MSAAPQTDVGSDPVEAFANAVFESFAESFAEQFRAWLVDVDAPARTARIHEASRSGSWEQEYELLLAWQAELAAGGWLVVGWPEAHGGRGATIAEQAVYERELARLDNPQLPAVVGVNMVGPSIIEFGTDEQKDRFLPGIAAGTSTWCQGFSEPDAGSDLASLSMRAERDGSGWRLTGQKIWTSFAHVAEYGCFLARTGRPADRHAGITVFLLEMDQDEVEVHPIETLDGRRKINSVFVDGAFVSEHGLLGEAGEGWKLVRAMLAQERFGVARLAFALEPLFKKVYALQGQSRSLSEDAEMRALYARVIAVLSSVNEQLRAEVRGVRDPATAATAKVLATELTQDLYRHGASGCLAGTTNPALQSAYLTSLSKTIAGGTTEIQLNIVAERALGLPR